MSFAEQDVVDDAVTLDNLSHWFVGKGAAKMVLHDVNLRVPENQFVTIVGASGCGKTTVLNLLAGMIKPEVGTVDIRISGEPVTPPSPSIGYMWARDALMPWRTLERNVEYGLEIRRVGKAERRAQARRYIDLVGLAGNEDRYPRQLSHGMRQRGNLARLLAVEPKLFLMDEPFSALDAQTKQTLQREFTRIWQTFPRTVVYVTHDLTEAALLADRVLVMSRGRIVKDSIVPFARPRNVDELRFDEEFLEYTKGLWHMLAEAEGKKDSDG